MSIGPTKERSTGKDPVGLQIVVSIECCNKTIKGCCREAIGDDDTTTAEAGPIAGDHGCRIGEEEVGTSRDEATKGVTGASVVARGTTLTSSS